MTDQPPISPFKLNRTRVFILVLGALAIVMIVGALLGGVSNYQELRESASSAAPVESSSASAP